MIRRWAAVAALCAAAIGLWTGLQVQRRPRPMPTATVVKTPVGEASAPTESDPLAWDQGLAPPGKIPAELPPFELHAPDGRPVSVARWTGRALVINFWATWCPPCRREIPLLQGLQASWSDRGVTVVGIAVDFPDKVATYARTHGIEYPLLVGEQDALDVAASLGVVSPAFPFTVFTDRRGRIVALYLGELHKPQADLILSVVDSLNQNRGDLPDARERIAAGLKKLQQAGAG